MTRCVLAMVALTTVGCTAAPSDRLTWRESWELIVLTGGGQVVDARMTVGNTGLLRGQGHLRLDRWAEGTSPIHHHRRAAPGETGVWPERERVRMGADLLDLERHTWTLRVHSDDAQGVIHLAPTDALKVAPAVGMTPTGQWSMTASVPTGRASGWVEAGKRGGQVDGRGFLLYRGGDGMPRGARRTLLLQGGDLSVGLEEHGDLTLAWLHTGGAALDTTGARLVETREGWVASFPEAEATVTLVGRDVGGSTPVRTDLMGPERLAPWALGQRSTRTVQAVQGTVVRPGSTQIVPGVLIQVTDDGEQARVRRRRR